MSKDQDNNKDQIQREIRSQQKFSMASAIGRAGSGLMKGASPVSQQEQATIVLTQWIDKNTIDPSGALKSVLRRRVRSNELLIAQHLSQPEKALRQMIETILSSQTKLREFVRQVDVRWGEMYRERPYFQKDGQPPHPDDEYTNESVLQDLNSLLEKL
jgi:hypothetical protein